MKEAKRTQVTEQICEQIRLMRKGGANQTEIGKLLGLSAPTISRIETAGFDLNRYLENKRTAKEKEKQRKQEPEEEREEEVPGQIRMDLAEAKPEGDWRKDFIQSEQTKMMRFQAHMTEMIAAKIEKAEVQICTKLDMLNDTMSMILRVVRRE